MTKSKTLFKRLSAAAVAAVMGAGLIVVAPGTADAVSADDSLDVNTLYQNGVELSTEIEEEGAVLFQNNDGALPLAGGTKVDLYGYMSYNIIHGGGGSGKGKWDSNCLQEKEAFELGGLDVNDALWDWHGAADGANLVQESWVADNGGELVNGNTYNIPEVTADTYKNYSGEKNDVAIVTFGRQGHEGAELPMHMDSNYVDSNLSIRGEYSRTYLEPTQVELDLLKYLDEQYEKVIVLLNTSNVMLIDEYLAYSDACLWIGGPGEAGLIGVAHVLQGEDGTGQQISPSGRTSDTWMSDFYSNVVFYNNGGGTTYTNAGNRNNNYNQYEEGIFMGYRWYETAYADKLEVTGTPVYADANGTVKEEAKTYNFYEDYDELVTMPFGGGLSYTTFDWEVVSSDIKLEAHGTNTITVRVTNTGDYAGKDTVQIYMNAPYYEGGIDKAEVVLVGFAKTDRLKPGESGTVEISFQTDDLASYDYLGYKAEVRGEDYRGNDKWGGFVLEAGDYEFRVQSDSHTQKTEPVAVTLAEDYLYTEEGELEGAVGIRESDKTEAYNKLNDVNATDGSGMIYMQRSTMAADWDTICNKNNPNALTTAGCREDELKVKASLGSGQETAINLGQQQTAEVTYKVPYQDITRDMTINYGYQASTEFVGNDNNYWGEDNNAQIYKDAVANVGKSTTNYTPDTRWTRAASGVISESDPVATGTDPTTTYGWDEVPADDGRWDDWVDQGSWEDYAKIQGTQYLGSYESMGLERGSASDGPGEAGTGGKENNTWWPSEVVMASTWNPEVVERMGQEYGKQCLATGITSCFGPGAVCRPFRQGTSCQRDIRPPSSTRSFCLRKANGECPLRGVGTFNKHFMLNDLDGGRSGQIDYCNEQAIREIYIRAWEYSMKCEEAPMSGMMASLNRIGITWANSGLYIGIVREEYGWNGLMISDGMDGVHYSGEVKATYSGIACLLWQHGVNDDSEAEQNDGYIFEDCVADASHIADYFGAYQLRGVAKSRLWYDTHILSSGEQIFNLADYWTAEVSYNYEEMDVADLDSVDYENTDKGEEETEGGCGSALNGVAALAAAVPVLAACAYVFRRRRSQK